MYYSLQTVSNYWPATFAHQLLLCTYVWHLMCACNQFYIADDNMTATWFNLAIIPLPLVLQPDWTFRNFRNLKYCRCFSHVFIVLLCESGIFIYSPFSSRSPYLFYLKRLVGVLWAQKLHSTSLSIRNHTAHGGKLNRNCPTRFRGDVSNKRTSKLGTTEG